MRQYRGKTTDGKWVKGYLMNMHQPERLFIGKWHPIGGEASIKDELFMSYKEVIPESVGQSTGKSDNHGKEIFAGDICRNGDWEEDAYAWNYRTEVVVWDECNACWLGWNDTTRGCCCEIIANTTDSPELVKERDNKLP